MSKVVNDMEKLVFNDISNLVNLMIDMDKKDFSVSVLSKYDISKQLLVELCKCGASILSLSIHDIDYNGYDREFEICILNGEIICCEVYDEENHRYLGCGADITLIHEDCSSRLISKIESEKVYEFELYCDGDCEHCAHDDNDEFFTDELIDLWQNKNVDDSDYCDDRDYCDVCNCCDEDDECNLPGFTRSWSSNEDGVFTSLSYSFHSTDKDLVNRKKKEFSHMFEY